MGNGLDAAWNALGYKYRQSVFNDFSVVSKAKFYVVKEKEESKSGLVTHVYKEVLPVQINPHNISRSSKKAFVNGKGLAESAASGKGISSNDSDSDTLDLELIYDVYDDYMVGTYDGLGVGIVDMFTKSNCTHLSLKDEDATSLEKLIQCASKEGEDYQSSACSVLFKWGSLEFFGKITSLSCRYDVFSRWGEPLKANVSVTITQETGKDNKPITLKDLGEAALEITAYEKAETAFNVIALGGSAVLR